MAETYVVQQGDCLSSIASARGFAHWRTIYDHPGNAAFRRLRPNPNLIYPGDSILIPDKEPTGADVATGATHTFRLKRSRTLLRLRLLDANGEPWANRPFELAAGDHRTSGTTGADGKIEEPIPPDAPDGHLRLDIGDNKAIEVDLRLGHLDPVEEVSGVQARLNNLGFRCGAVDGIAGPLTTAAVMAFQQACDLPATGEADAATRAALRRKHDGY